MRSWFFLRPRGTPLLDLVLVGKQPLLKVYGRELQSMAYDRDRPVLNGRRVSDRELRRGWVHLDRRG